jgi:hypothetical protein
VISSISRLRSRGKAKTPSHPAASTRPRTGDIVIDAALTDLAVADAGDLDAILDRGEAVHRTLQGRLADLGG